MAPFDTTGLLFDAVWKVGPEPGGVGNGVDSPVPASLAFEFGAPGKSNDAMAVPGPESVILPPTGFDSAAAMPTGTIPDGSANPPPGSTLDVGETTGSLANRDGVRLLSGGNVNAEFDLGCEGWGGMGLGESLIANEFAGVLAGPAAAGWGFKLYPLGRFAVGGGDVGGGLDAIGVPPAAYPFADAAA